MHAQPDRLMRMLRASRGIVSNDALATELGRKARLPPERRIAFALSRARKRLAPGESIENYRNLGYQLVIDIPRA